MEVYKRFVRQNKEFVHSLESLANGLTWVLPERFSNSEIGPEAVYALLNIISSLNQHIIDTIPSRIPQWKSARPSIPWSLCISALKDLEAVVEVAAQCYYGDDGKWNFIALTEAAKVIARLAFLRDSGYQMLLQGGEVANEGEGKDASKINLSELPGHGRPNGYYGPGNFQDYRGYDPCSLEGRALSALNRFGGNAKMVSDPMLFNRQPPFTEPPVALVKKPSLSEILSEKGLAGGLFVTGEVLFILRPLIYVLFIRKYGIKSWIPWLLSLAVDFTGMGILNHVSRPTHGPGKKFVPLSASEKDEVKRRKLLWALYIMRDPFFTQYTRNRLENTGKYLNHVPLIGFLTEKLVELLVGAQTRYTYTSGS